MNDLQKIFKEKIKKSNYIVALTGAGLSAESGIPTYRGKGGLWSKYDPSIYANINYFNKDPAYFWNFFRYERYPILKKALPNDSHLSLVELEKKLNLKQIITQNIDGLHTIAGNKNVIELHGNARKIKCLNCFRIFTIEEIYEKIKNQIPPKCNCGGKLRPATVFFGEALPIKAIQNAKKAAEKCDMFMVIGSSLVVHPAAELPVIAKENNAFLVIINIDQTPLDSIADIVFNSKASKILKNII